MNADWFEMKEIRRRRFANAVWIPLHAEEPVVEEGRYGYPNYRREFFGLGSLAVPLAKRDAVQRLGWNDIGISHQQGIWAKEEFYKPADIYWYNANEDLGIELALIQNFDGAEPGEWHLNQDLVFALGLLREGDFWVRPWEDYVVVAQLRRHTDGKPFALEIRNEYLRDYLCARKCLLRLTWCRVRDVIVADPADAGSPKKKHELANSERFELGMFSVLEGGNLPGGYSVLNIARTDVDPEEDVPVPGPETDENVESRSWRGALDGKKYFRIQGEVWRDEEIEPATTSPRVRGDSVPTGISYIVDASGSTMTSE